MRIITRTNFADGCTIDGNVVDHALSDAVARINRIEPGDLKRRWLPQKLVTGYQPIPAGLACVPFLPDPNTGATTLGGAPAAGYNAGRRVKGTHITNQKDIDYVWTVALAFDSPVWLVEATACLIRDLGSAAAPPRYDNDWVYDATAPAHKVNGNPVDDIHLVVSVDDPWRPEDRNRNAVVVARHRFDASAEYLCPLAPAGGWPDMLPPWPPAGGPPGRLEGVAVRAVDCAVPIHRGGRVRFALVLPQWPTVPAGGRHPWHDEPWTHQYYSLDLTWLEEVVE